MSGDRCSRCRRPTPVGAVQCPYCGSSLAVGGSLPSSVSPQGFASRPRPENDAPGLLGVGTRLPGAAVASPIGWVVSYDPAWPGGRAWTLHVGKTLIGTGADCTIRVPQGRGVGAEHAVILWRGWRATLAPLESGGALALNGCPLSSTGVAETLASGAQLTVGEVHFLLFLLEPTPVGLVWPHSGLPPGPSPTHRP